jgi:hypothetical protein
MTSRPIPGFAGAASMAIRVNSSFPQIHIRICRRG